MIGVVGDYCCCRLFISGAGVHVQVVLAGRHSFHDGTNCLMRLLSRFVTFGLLILFTFAIAKEPLLRQGVAKALALLMVLVHSFVRILEGIKRERSLSLTC